MDKEICKNCKREIVYMENFERMNPEKKFICMDHESLRYYHFYILNISIFLLKKNWKRPGINLFKKVYFFKRRKINKLFYETEIKDVEMVDQIGVPQKSNPYYFKCPYFLEHQIFNLSNLKKDKNNVEK